MEWSLDFLTVYLPDPILVSSGRHPWSLRRKCLSGYTIIVSPHEINPTCPYDTTPYSMPAKEGCRVIHCVRRFGVRGGSRARIFVAINFRPSGSPHITATSLMGVTGDSRQSRPEPTRLTDRRPAPRPVSSLSGSVSRSLYIVSPVLLPVFQV